MTRERQREKYLERQARAEAEARDTYRGAAKAPTIDEMRAEFLDGDNEAILLQQLGRLDARDPAQWDPINVRYEASVETFAEAFAVVAKAAKRDWRRFDLEVFRECAGLAKLALPERLMVAQADAETIEHYDALRAQQDRKISTLDEIAAAGGYQIIYADPPWSYNQRGRGAAENHYETMSIDDLEQLPVERLAAENAVLFLWATMPLLPEALDLGRAWGFSYKTCAFTWIKHYEPSGKPAMGGGMWTRANAELCLLFVRGEPPRRVSRAVRQLVETGPDDKIVCDDGVTVPDYNGSPTCECGHSRSVHLEDPSGYEGNLCIHVKAKELQDCGCNGYKPMYVPQVVGDVLRAPRGSHSAKPVEVRRRIDALMGEGPSRVELFARERADGWDAWGAEVPGGSDFELGDER